MRDKVLNFLKREIDLEHIPGAVISVSYKGEVIVEEAIGNGVVLPEKKPLQIDTVFDLASLTKIIATLPAILKLLEAGELRLDDPVAYFLPNFAQNGKGDIKVRHLLTHSSGLPAHRQYYLEKLTSNQVIQRIYAEQLVSPIGSKVIYSDLGLIILYNLIEEITSQKFDRFVDDNIFTPLAMKDTGFNPSFSRNRYAATEYNETLNDYKHGIVHDDNTESMGGISGHAGLFSTIQNLQNFTRMIENNGIFNGKRVLSASTIELSRRNYTPFDSEFRGLGWILKSPTLSSCGDLFSDQSYGHTGFTGTSIWFDPKIQLNVILLTNRVHFGRKPHILRLRPRLHNIIRSHF